MKTTVREKGKKEVRLSRSAQGSLHTIFVSVGEVDLVTEEHHPLAKLDRSHHYAVGSPAVLTVVVKGLQQELRGCCTGEVQTHNLKKKKQVKKLQTSGKSKVHLQGLCYHKGFDFFYSAHIYRRKLHFHIGGHYLEFNNINNITSMSGSALSAEKSVMVLPEPGGPQRTRGRCSASQV